MPSTSERVKASKIRASIKAGKEVSTEEAAWFADYEQAREKVVQTRGASQSRKVSYTEEETAAVGEGSPEAAAAAASALPAAVKEEGQRLDSILTIGIAALKESNAVYGQLVGHLIRRTENFEDTMVKMMRAQTDLLHAHRENALKAIDAEVRAVAAEAGQQEDGISKLANELLPLLIEKMGK